jgi:hypothetical protein
LLPREADAAAMWPVPLNTHEFRPGNASFKNRAMLSHAQMMPACDSMARFLKDGQILSRLCARAAPEGGRHYGVIGRLVVGARWTVHF